MPLLRWLLLLIVLLLVARALWRLVAGVISGATGVGGPTGRRPPAHPPAVRMARDPICGTYVVPGRALELARGRDMLYFCSDKCRDAYLQKR